MTHTVAELRFRYIVFALLTIVAGLLVHVRGASLPADVRDFGGDALWAMMIVWWVSAIVPRARLPLRAIAAWSICAAVELSQLYHTPALDALRSTTLGHLVLGSDFDVRDLAAYAAGVAMAVVIGREPRARRSAH